MRRQVSYPDARSQSRAQPDGEQEVEGDDPEPHPDRPIVRDERNEHLGQTEARERVDQHREHVNDDEDKGEETQIAVAARS